MSGKGDLNLMKELATDMVMQQAMKDKLEQHEKEESQNQQQETREAKGPEEENDPDFDDDFQDEQAEEIMRKMMEQRVQRHSDHGPNKKGRNNEGVGEYIEVDEDKFFLYTTRDKFVTCHFYHNDFKRCKIIDSHLQTIAYSHPECKFIKVNVEKAPFLVKKLGIQVLPTIICFVDGKSLDRVVGFEDLGAKDEFATVVLTRRLAQASVVDLKDDEQVKIINKKKRLEVRGEESSEED